MEKRLITAIALSILIVVAFQYLAVKPNPAANVPIPKATTVAKPAEILPVAEPQNIPEEKEIEALG